MRDEKTFRFLPPSPEDSRAFLAQLGATLLSFVVIGLLFWRSSEVGLRAVLLGAGVGVLFLLARAAWKLELKAARSQRGSLAIDADGFTLALDTNKSPRIAWSEITTLEVRGGKLHIAWIQNGRKQYYAVSARELEDGMEAVQLLAARGESPPAAPAANFIPLSPK